MSDLYIGVDVVASHIAEDQKIILIDARTPEEYTASHAVGAINVPIDALPIYAQDYIKAGKNEPVITMCGSTGRGEKAEAILTLHGVKNVKVMSGGLKAWKDENFPVE